MIMLRALLRRRDLSKPLLESGSSLLHSTTAVLDVHIPAGSINISSQRQQLYCSGSCTKDEGGSLVQQPRLAAKTAAAHGQDRRAAWKIERGPRPTATRCQGKDGTQAPKQSLSSEGRSAAHRFRWISIDELKAKETCEEVWDMLSTIPPQGIHAFVLSAALDHMVAVTKRPGYQQTQEGLSAMQQLLNVAEGRLGSTHSRGMVAFIRCAAGFKGLLQPAGLLAWQRELLQRPQLVEQLTAQGVANTLLALGTLTESDPQLARVLGVQLAGQLLQHAVGFANATGYDAPLSVWHAANILYGAALLGLQPDGAQVAALFSAVERGVRGMGKEDIAQVLLASKKLIDRAHGLRQGQGLEACRPDLDPYWFYYPGNEIMGLLLERTCELIQQRRLYPQAASQILGACGSLGYLPPHVALEQLLAVLGTGELNSIGASTTLVGCARLGVVPPDEVIEACQLALKRDGAQDIQATANIAWALALLGACTSEMWGKLTARLLENMHKAPQVAIYQWHQAYLLIKMQHGESVACPPELLERSLAAHKAVLARRTPPTHFERVLAEAVRQVAPGQKVRVEYVVSDSQGQGGLRVDVALPGLQLAVEADGPHHFLRNVEPLQQDGTTKARDRLLWGWGWRVVFVPWYVWDQLPAQGVSHEELVAGLGQYLLDDTDFKEYIKVT